MAFSYSVMLDIKARRVLVCGGGSVAWRKIRRLLTAQAHITVIAPEVVREIMQHVEKGELTLEKRCFKLDDIKALPPFAVIAATDDAALNRSIADYCKAHNILCNTITEPEHGSFAVQAEIPRARYAVSISTFGQGPGFSRALREYLEPLLDARLDLAVAVYIALRDWLLVNEDDAERRQAALRRLSLAGLCQMIDEGTNDYHELLERVKEWLSYS